MDIFLTWKPRQGVTYEVAVTGGLSLRDEVDISYWKYYTTSPPSKVASRGWGIFQAKEKATLFRGRLYYYYCITYSVVPSVSYSL